jgi:hypothetical protein
MGEQAVHPGRFASDFRVVIVTKERPSRTQRFRQLPRDLYDSKKRRTSYDGAIEHA